jgi:PAS domain S-box-containing protein
MELYNAPMPDEHLFYEAFKASPIGIALETLEGQPLFANVALCSMLGFSEEEMRTRHCVDFSPPEDAKKDWALFEQLRAGLIDHYSLDKRFFRKDGSLIWGHLSISLLNHRPRPLVIGMVADIMEKRAAEERAQELQVNLQRLTGHMIEAQEEERRHLARELHDDISQKLGLLSVNFQSFLTRLPDSLAPLRSQLEPLLKQTETISEDVRDLSHRFHISKLETLGLVPTMRSFCRELSERRNVCVNFVHTNMPDELPDHVSLCLFRVLQEGLTNAVKYSGVDLFEARVEQVADELHLTIRDEGTGFDPGMAMFTTGIGLISMRERVKLVHGTMSIKSGPKSGTEIQVRVPVPECAQPNRPSVD